MKHENVIRDITIFIMYRDTVRTRIDYDIRR